MKVLYINLTTGSSKTIERIDLKEELGGTGTATALFLEEVKQTKAPLDEEQPIVITRGAFSPYFPAATKSIAVFYSPLTGQWGESHAGGRLGLALSLAGVDAIVITGKSKNLVYVVIDDGEVKIKEAFHLIGIPSTQTASYIREKEKRAGLRSILRIGPAGEQLAGYAMVIVDTYRHFGRLGLGAVFGSKNLKAILISGTGKSIRQLENFNSYRTFFEELQGKLTSPEMRKYHEYGTALNILPLNEMGALPTKNLKDSRFPFASHISGEAFAETVLTKKLACAGCPVGCIHIATLRRKFAAEEEWERVDISYDYELIYALGTLLGIKECNGILSLIETVEELGIDAIYGGVLLAWITEAYERGLIGDKELSNHTPTFGDSETYKKMLEEITYSHKEFYRTARKGIEALCEKYGGKEFALLVNKNAMAGYHTGYANLLGQHLIGARNAHTDNGGYAIDQENIAYTPEQIIDKLYHEEIMRTFYNCTGLCLFVRKIYDIDTTIKAFSLLGNDLTKEDIYKIGEKIYLRKLTFRVKCGFKIEDYEIAQRFFETKAAGKIMDKIFIERAKKYFAEKIKEKIRDRD